MSLDSKYGVLKIPAGCLSAWKSQDIFFFFEILWMKFFGALNVKWITWMKLIVTDLQKHFGHMEMMVE